LQVVRTRESSTTTGKRSIGDAKNVLAIGVKCPAMTRIVAVSVVSALCLLLSEFLIQMLFSFAFKVQVFVVFTCNEISLLTYTLSNSSSETDAFSKKTKSCFLNNTFHLLCYVSMVTRTILFFICFIVCLLKVEGCDIDGKVYPYGTKDIPHRDGCNTCVCEDDGSFWCSTNECSKY